MSDDERAPDTDIDSDVHFGAALHDADTHAPDVDRTWNLLRDTAEVHAVRGEVAPVVRDFIASLSEDPLGEERTTIRLTETLNSPRARSARKARERIQANLQNEVHTR